MTRLIQGRRCCARTAITSFRMPLSARTAGSRPGRHRGQRAPTRRTADSVGVPVARPGYAVPAGSYEAVPVRHTTHSRAVDGVGRGYGGRGRGGGRRVSVLATPVVPRYVCPPDCGEPPIGKPVAANPWFTSTRRQVRGPISTPRYGV